MRPTWADLAETLMEARARLEIAIPGRGVEARPLAIGWATVESERAEAELVHAFGARLGAFEDAPDDPYLGARCRSAAGGPASFLTVLEPTTEGRLAGSLARLDEGPLVTWFTLEMSPVDGVSEATDGPFGPERLVVLGPRDGRYLFLLAGRPGTIAT